MKIKASPSDKSPTKPRKVEDESNKGINKRGRPRVESHDQNAVECRRIQIRIAQRAYRERKETTISELEAQVSQLRQVIQEMNKTFVECSDKTLASGVTGIQPSFDENLRLASERFQELIRDVELKMIILPLHSQLFQQTVDNLQSLKQNQQHHLNPLFILYDIRNPQW